MGHYYHHEALGDLVSSDSGEEESDEEVWDPLMYFQEGEPIRELNIFMETKIERQDDGLTVTVIFCLRSFSLTDWRLQF